MRLQKVYLLRPIRNNKIMINPISFISWTFMVVMGFSMFSCFSDESSTMQPTLRIDCSEFSYSDTIFYIKAGQNFTVNPVNSLSGTYAASPNGLVINANSGVIDVNASETGLKYKISFTPTGTDQVCETFVTIGGVNYLDGVYVLNQNQLTASPIYNGVPGLALPCEDDDEDDGEDDEDEDEDDDDDSSCDFDAANPTGQLLRDLGFEISNKGIIDLQKTVENGTFGAIPVNGTILDVDLYYRLNDLSTLALNSIPLRFFYYDRLSDVPKEVLDDMAEKSALINQLPENKNSNFRLLETVRPAGKPRPPYVVIVATLE